MRREFENSSFESECSREFSAGFRVQCNREGNYFKSAGQKKERCSGAQVLEAIRSDDTSPSPQLVPDHVLEAHGRLDLALVADERLLVGGHGALGAAVEGRHAL